MTPNTSPLDDMRAALAAHDRAARAVAESLDYWLGITPSMHIPTSLLILVDAYRETGAQMLAYLPEAPAGPTQDQATHVLSVEMDYANGLTTEAEHQRLMQEAIQQAAHNAEPEGQRVMNEMNAVRAGLKGMSFYCRPQDINS